MDNIPANNNQIKRRKFERNNRADVFSLFLPEIRELIASRNFVDLKNILKEIYSIDLAEGFSKLNIQEQILIFKLLTIRKAIAVFEDLSLSQQQDILNNLESQEVAQVLNEMAADERAKLFKDLPEKAVKKLFGLLKNEKADDVRRLLTYKSGTAGSIMTTDFVELKADMTARKAIISLQESQRTLNSTAVYSCYITDEQHRLLGGVSLQDIIKAPPDIMIKEIMTGVSHIKINAKMSLSDVGVWFKKYDLLDAPVVDNQNVLLGIITIDDVVDVIEKHTTREFYEVGKMSGAEIRYSQANSMDLVKRRVGWLILLLVFDFLTGTVLKTFEHALSSVVALAFFIPMLLDTGGNAGAQASITIIRGLATGDVTFKNVWKIIRLEVLASFLMAIVVGVVAFMRAFMLQPNLLVALVVGSTMSLITVLAIATGVFLPLASKKIGLDPAVLAGPITTSIVDIVGLIIYFKVAQLIIPALR